MDLSGMMAWGVRNNSPAAPIPSTQRHLPGLQARGCLGKLAPAASRRSMTLGGGGWRCAEVRACRPSAPLHTVFQRSCRPLAGQSPDVQRPGLPGGPPSEKKEPQTVHVFLLSFIPPESVSYPTRFQWSEAQEAWS